MSKSRNKNRSEIEYIKGQLKKVQTENRQLKKRIRQLDKKSHFYENIVDEAVEEASLGETCESCGKGTMHHYDLVHVKLEICDLCGYKRNLSREKTK